MNEDFQEGLPKRLGNQYGAYVFEFLLISGDIIEATVDLSEKEITGLRWIRRGSSTIIPSGDIKGWRRSPPKPDLLEDLLHTMAADIRTPRVMTVRELPANES